MQLWRRLTRANIFLSSIRAVSSATTKRTMTAPLSPSKATSPYNFILDFDGTITTHDTIFTVANIALSIQQQNYGQDLTQKWSDCVSAYTEDYTQHVKTQTQIQTKNNQNQERNARDSIAEEISFQRGLKEVEDRSFMRVGESGLFKGISGIELERAGGEAVKNRDVVIRSGFKDFVMRVQGGGGGGGGGGRWGILSVNFSRDFIRGVVTCALGGNDDDEEGDKKEGREEEEEVLVVANSSDVKTGFLSGPGFGREEVPPEEGRRLLTTSADKMVFMNRIFGGEEWRGRGVVYIGDSGTDLECLLEADIGIVVTDEKGRSKLLDRLRELGTEVESIGMYQAGHRKCLYWAKDYGEILKVEELFDVTLGS